MSERDDLDKVLNAIRKAGLEPVELELKPPTISDNFVEKPELQQTQNPSNSTEGFQDETTN